MLLPEPRVMASFHEINLQPTDCSCCLPSGIVGVASPRWRRRMADGLRIVGQQSLEMWAGGQTRLKRTLALFGCLSSFGFCLKSVAHFSIRVPPDLHLSEDEAKWAAVLLEPRWVCFCRCVVWMDEKRSQNQMWVHRRLDLSSTNKSPNQAASDDRRMFFCEHGERIKRKKGLWSFWWFHLDFYEKHKEKNLFLSIIFKM